jgi:hypothetical protein
MLRILAAGVLGGTAMFIWSSIAHMALPLGEAGVREVPNEQAVLSAIQNNVGDKPGLYIFPGTGLGPDASKEQKKEAMRHLAAFRVSTLPAICSPRLSASFASVSSQRWSYEKAHRRRSCGLNFGGWSLACDLGPLSQRR